MGALQQVGEEDPKRETSALALGVYRHVERDRNHVHKP